MTTSSPIVLETPAAAQGRAPRSANNRRRLIAALDTGCQIYLHWGNRYMIWSPRSGRLHQVVRLVDGACVRWECSDTCEHYARHGAFEQYLLGTEAHHTNNVKPCAHVLIALCAALSVERRAEKFAADAALRVAWNRAHARRPAIAA